MVCDKVVCERWCVKDDATPATQNEGRCLQVPHLLRETKVDVTKCHACHVKQKADASKCHACHAKFQSAPASPATKTSPSAPPSAISATPCTQNERECLQVPQLLRETKVDVAKCHACHVKPKVDVSKCHACHAKCPGVTGD